MARERGRARAGGGGGRRGPRPRGGAGRGPGRAGWDGSSGRGARAGRGAFLRAGPGRAGLGWAGLGGESRGPAWIRGRRGVGGAGRGGPDLKGPQHPPLPPALRGGGALESGSECECPFVSGSHVGLQPALPPVHFLGQVASPSILHRASSPVAPGSRVGELQELR
ncbi:rRNA 2'-O-methyltransferase fibrillarin-like [Eptesicus fuscus]|uniref:rRNA 2'-O-methyltransferase fibrillarin-like n=1 Tax=Eptesicus fuscus TaxID=29078 RepID=UPI0024040716|nr:rRNA 2'-O-methyltransferase fibrillarin-like [Eptesicus fuscus]